MPGSPVSNPFCSRLGSPVGPMSQLIPWLCLGLLRDLAPTAPLAVLLLATEGYFLSTSGLLKQRRKTAEENDMDMKLLFSYVSSQRDLAAMRQVQATRQVQGLEPSGRAVTAVVRAVH